jgi:hypothetical protein
MIEDDPGLLDRARRHAAASRAPARTGRRTTRDVVGDLAGIRLRLADRVEDGIERLAAQLRANPNTDWNELRGGVDSIISNERRERVLAELQEKNERTAEATRVAFEPPPYSPQSPWSWSADLFTVHDPTVTGLPTERVHDAEVRLGKHAEDVARAFKGTSPWSQHIQGVFRDQTRREDPSLHRRLANEAEKELRAVGTGGGSTASSVSGASVVSTRAASIRARHTSPHSTLSRSTNNSMRSPVTSSYSAFMRRARANIAP